MLQIDSVWGWASPPLRLQVAGGTRGASGSAGLAAAAQSSQQRMGEMVVDRAPSPSTRLSLNSEKHPKATLSELATLRRHRELCDVVLNVGSRKIFAHRVILSACSPYFRCKGILFFFFESVSISSRDNWSLGAGSSSIVFFATDFYALLKNWSKIWKSSRAKL